MKSFNSIGVILFSLLLPNVAHADVQIEPGLIHLRVEGPREWSTFPETPDAHELVRTFSAKRNSQAVFLRVRHQDVKQTWSVELNGKAIGELKIDENDMVEYFVVPTDAVIDGENNLRIFQTSKRRQDVDDIRVGEIVLGDMSREQLLSESAVEVRVLDAGTGSGIPARITVTNASGALQSVGAKSNDHLAVRPGIVYTSTGNAGIRFAGR